jgi:hypothetical protein
MDDALCAGFLYGAFWKKECIGRACTLMLVTESDALALWRNMGRSFHDAVAEADHAKFCDVSAWKGTFALL